MRRVLAEVGDDHHLDDLQRQRLRLHDLVEPQAAGRRRQDGGRHHGQQRRHLHQQVTDEEVQGVGGPARTKHGLVRTLREQPLQRDEDHREQQQVEQEPVEAQIDAAACTAFDRHVGAAEQQRRQRQADACHRQRLARPQQRGEQPEQKAGADDELDQRAHHRQRVARPQIDLRQQLGVVQARDRAQSERAEEDRRRAAEPPRAQVRGLVVAKDAGKPVIESGPASDRHAPW